MKAVRQLPKCTIDVNNSCRDRLKVARFPDHGLTEYRNEQNSVRMMASQAPMAVRYFIPCSSCFPKPRDELVEILGYIGTSAPCAELAYKLKARVYRLNLIENLHCHGMEGRGPSWFAWKIGTH